MITQNISHPKTKKPDILFQCFILKAIWHFRVYCAAHSTGTFWYLIRICPESSERKIFFHAITKKYSSYVKTFPTPKQMLRFKRRRLFAGKRFKCTQEKQLRKMSIKKGKAVGVPFLYSWTASKRRVPQTASSVHPSLNEVIQTVQDAYLSVAFPSMISSNSLDLSGTAVSPEV